MQEDLTYIEHPVKILETSERVTRNKRIRMCRVQWSLEQLSLGFLHHTSSAAFEAVPTLEVEIRQYQKEDEKLQEIRELLKKGKAPHFREDD